MNFLYTHLLTIFYIYANFLYQFTINICKYLILFLHLYDRAIQEMRKKKTDRIHLVEIFS